MPPSRRLVLLGIRQGKIGMIALGFLIFTLLDGTAGTALLSGKLGVVSLWWFELAFSVFALSVSASLVTDSRWRLTSRDHEKG